jgi:hypothetical protein
LEALEDASCNIITYRKISRYFFWGANGLTRFACNARNDLNVDHFNKTELSMKLYGVLLAYKLNLLDRTIS